MPRIGPYHLPMRGPWANRINTVPVDSKLLGEPLVELEQSPENAYGVRKRDFSKSGMPTQQLSQSFHQFASGSFASARSQGLIKNLDEVSGFQAHQIRMSANWQGSIRLEPNGYFESPNPPHTGSKTDWKINRLQLVSLLLHGDARIYETENLPNMEELGGKDVPTRALNDFETKSLAKLESGENVVTQSTPNRLVMLGALRAEASCTQCHLEKKGELLGAFSYEFLRDPKVDWKRRGL